MIFPDFESAVKTILTEDVALPDMIYVSGWKKATVVLDDKTFNDAENPFFKYQNEISSPFIFVKITNREGRKILVQIFKGTKNKPIDDVGWVLIDNEVRAVKAITENDSKDSEDNLEERRSRNAEGCTINKKASK